MVLVLIWWTRLENSGMKENMMKSSKLINFLKNLKTENKNHLYHSEFRILNKLLQKIQYSDYHFQSSLPRRHNYMILRWKI